MGIELIGRGAVRREFVRHDYPVAERLSMRGAA
jgi:hypothetical protein